MSDRKRTRTTDSLSLDALFRIVSDRRRRAVIAVLAARGREMTVDEVAASVVHACETPATANEDEVYVSLFHHHLPKLADTPLVDYDERQKVVAPTETFERLEPLLSRVAEADSVRSLLEETPRP